jgi:hypothetical protein
MGQSTTYSEGLLEIFTQGILQYNNLSAKQISSKISENLVASNFVPVDLDLGYQMEIYELDNLLIRTIESLEGVPNHKLGKKIIKSLQSCGLDFVDKSIPNYIPQTQSTLIDNLINTKIKVDNIAVILRYIQGDDAPLLIAKEHIERLSNEFEVLRFGCLDINYSPTVSHQELSGHINGLVTKANDVIERIDNELHITQIAQPSPDSLKPN